MIKRLPVAADQFDFHVKAALGREHSVGVEFAEQEIEARQIRYGDPGGVHGAENTAANLFRVRIFRVSEKMELWRGFLRF